MWGSSAPSAVPLPITGGLEKRKGAGFYVCFMGSCSTVWELGWKRVEGGESVGESVTAYKRVLQNLNAFVRKEGGGPCAHDAGWGSRG